MKALALAVLCFLGLIANQVSTAVDTYSTYYAELEMESSALPHITKELEIVNSISLSGSDVTLQYLNITTECNISAGAASCSCKENYIWSNSECSANPQCCNKEQCVVTTINHTPMCIPESRVIITGTITLDELYDPDYADTTSQDFLQKSASLTDILKTSFSELSGFDYLQITKLSQGSVVAHFEMAVNAAFQSSDLAAKVDKVQQNLTAMVAVETSGLVKMKIKEGPVCFHTKQDISCEFVGPAESTWFLGDYLEILTGTDISVVTGPEYSTHLTLFKTSADWRGDYECVFMANNINHTARGYLDIALLPEDIVVTVEPQFPDCYTNKADKTVTIEYKIKDENENYTVSTDTNPDIPPKAVSPDYITYEVSNFLINCKATQEDYDVTLTFKNRLNQTKAVTTTIPVIKDKPFCDNVEDWPKAKNGCTAILPCSDGSVGKRERKCNATGKWEDEISYCVYKPLSSILDDALRILKGLGSIRTNAHTVFARMANTTTKTNDIKSYANINASVEIFSAMSNATRNSSETSKPISEETLQNILVSASNILNENLNNSWKPQTENTANYNLSPKYMHSIENLALNTNMSDTKMVKKQNIEFQYCRDGCENQVFNVSVERESKGAPLKVIGFKTLADILPNTFNNDKSVESSSIVVSATLDEEGSGDIKLTFQLNKKRPHNHNAYCVFWDYGKNEWSKNGCTLKKKDQQDQIICECNHLTSFSTLMSKYPVKLPFIDELTYIGLGISICSLILCIVIEALVWNSVVKSSVAHFRHTALVNISLCLLLADICFLASDFIGGRKEDICPILVVLKHFLYLAMFFWMLCLSVMLLHKLIFVFHQVRKKVYLAFSISLGYVCPALIVMISYLFYDNGKTYYNKESCWLTYTGLLEGSIHAFILPVGVIIFINLFSLVVVISKLLRPSVSEGEKGDEKEMAKSILKAVVFLTPIFGITWILGFFVLIVDLSDGLIPKLVHYLFTLFNAFQGLFILLTGCFGEQKVREALLKYLTSVSKSTKSETSSRFTSSFTKK
ncbi:hypothetical protein AGOR_G00109500 [Albula goreensis]|uniref:Uncharacterized protein n=1 Tax=Albula goreensis TaxID=1534307 RepID=A0A8T3DNC1_9TELE|nr:hypothetical protein AGOR_G00109500 [Albula goreensis]